MNTSNIRLTWLESVVFSYNNSGILNSARVFFTFTHLTISIIEAKTYIINHANSKITPRLTKKLNSRITNKVTEPLINPRFIPTSTYDVKPDKLESELKKEELNYKIDKTQEESNDPPTKEITHSDLKSDQTEIKSAKEELNNNLDLGQNNYDKETVTEETSESYINQSDINPETFKNETSPEINPIAIQPTETLPNLTSSRPRRPKNKTSRIITPK